jgi:spermidine/putrescine transport system permease protein
MGIPRNVATLFIGHVAVTLPYAVLVIGARLAGIDPQLEEAAYSLGAGPLYAFRRVTLPLIGPGVLAAALFSVAISFDNFILSYFLAPPGTPILPVEIYTAIRQGFTPTINAISTIVFVVSALLIFFAARGGDLLRGVQEEQNIQRTLQ